MSQDLLPRRDVIRRCLYGVDINPMSAELCKVALWIESIDPGKPLTFLDAHIQVGNSLLGTTPRLLAEGIPDNAFKPIEGDVKTLASDLKKRNKKERKDRKKGQNYLFEPYFKLGNLPSEFTRLSSGTDDSVADVADKERRYAELVSGSDYRNARLLADTWCAVFVWLKDMSDLGRLCPTERDFRMIESNPHIIPAQVKNRVQSLANQYQFFHWHLTFPDVFLLPKEELMPENDQTGWSGGFDIVLGNPPWERISLKEREFFGGKDDAIANETNSAKRTRAINELEGRDPVLHRDFTVARDHALRTKHLLSSSSRFPLSAVGDINTFALFTDLYDQSNSDNGSCGLITQTQLITEKTYSRLTRSLLQRHRIASCFAFENERLLFRGAHHSTRFVLLTLGRDRSVIDCATALWDPAWLKDPTRRYTLGVEDIRRLNPDTWSIPQFRTPRDASIAAKVYRKVPLLDDGTNFRKAITISRIMHDKDDANVISWDRNDSESQNRLPLLESKLLEHFNHRYASYEGVSDDAVRRGYPRGTVLSERRDAFFAVVPRKWVAEEDTPVRFQSYKPKWMFHVRKITNNIAIRTITAAITPRHPNNGSAAWVRNNQFATADYLTLIAVFNSFVFDYFARQKVAGINLNSYHLKQLPVPCLPTEENNPLHRAIVLSALELSFTSWDIAELMKELALEWGIPELASHPPFTWNVSRRESVRCQLDALIALLYGLDPEELKWVLDAEPPSESFRVLREAEFGEHGEFRTKRLILEYFDALREGIAAQCDLNAIVDPIPGPPTDTEGNFIPMDQWDSTNWPSHIHPPRNNQCGVNS